MSVCRAVFAASALVCATAAQADPRYDFDVRDVPLGDVAQQVHQLTGHELAGGWHPIRDRRISVSVEQCDDNVCVQKKLTTHPGRSSRTPLRSRPS